MVTYKIRVNRPCRLFLDDKEIAILDELKLTKFELPEFGGTPGHLSICPKCKRQIEFIETLHYSANRDQDLSDLL